MPAESLVTELHGSEHSIAGVCTAQLVFARWHAVDGDKEPTALGHPLRNCVRQLFADGGTHACSVIARPASRKRQGRAGSPLHAVSLATHKDRRARVTRPTFRCPTVL